jgi:hypothetical protein
MRFLLFILIGITLISCFSQRKAADFSQVKKTMDSIYVLPPLFNIKTLVSNKKSFVDTLSNEKIYQSTATKTSDFLSQRYTVLRHRKYIRYPKDSVVLCSLSNLFYFSLISNKKQFCQYQIDSTLIEYLNNFSNNYFLVYYISGYKKDNDMYIRQMFGSAAVGIISIAMTPVLFYYIPVKYSLQMEVLLIDKSKKRLLYFDRYNLKEADPYNLENYSEAIEILNDYIY